MSFAQRFCVMLFCSTVALAGCAGTENQPKQTSTYDLSKLSELTDDMPPGFNPYPFEVRKLEPVLVPGVGTVVSYGKPFTVEPPECRVLLKSVDAQAGADTAGFRAGGQDKRSISVIADMPVNVPDEIPATGCDRMTYQVPDDGHPMTGTVERIAAPNIDAAITYGLKVTVDGFPDPEYFYAAILDNHVYVNVNARLAPDFQAQPLLPDLLTKAVTAIRGQ
jgi:hypothetical protein